MENYLFYSILKANYAPFFHENYGYVIAGESAHAVVLKNAIVNSISQFRYISACPLPIIDIQTCSKMSIPIKFLRRNTRAVRAHARKV